MIDKTLPSATPPSRIILTPLVPGVTLPDFEAPFTLRIRSFSLDERGVDTKTLAPARNNRLFPTGLKIDIPKDLYPLMSTSSVLHAMHLEATSYTIDPSGELRINVNSYRHDSINVENGTVLAIFHFVSKVVVEVENKIGGGEKK